MTSTMVVGGTGAMGRPVVTRLLAASPDATVAVLTRNPDSARARAMATAHGDRLRFVAGDLDEPSAVRRAVSGVEQVFCNTDFFATASVLGEVRQGTSVLDAAREAGVERFVWSSLDGAASLTDGRVPVPHYDAKAAVAARIQMLRAEETMTREDDGWYTEHVSVLTTSPYFENFPDQLAPAPATLPDGRDGLLFTLPFGSARYPLIGLEDIAWFADHMFRHWQSWGARDLAVISESLTGDQVAATFEAVTGIPAAYTPLPLDVLRDSIPDLGHDFAAMCRFFQERDVLARDRDAALLARLHPGMLTFSGWLRATGWTGAPQGPATTR